MSQKDSIIEKLRGSENFHTWKFAMESVLDLHDLQGCIIEPVTEKDEAKLRKAKAKIILCIDESIYVHIQNKTSALDIWKTLKQLYEDTGLTRKIGLLRKLITVRLDNCDTMSDYVNQLICSANKLSGIGFDISSEWLGAIMLAGLGEEFKPFIMGIESSGTSVTAENIKMKLLDNDYSKTGESAFFTKKRTEKNVSKSKFKCYNCGRKGHFSKDCREKKRVQLNANRCPNAFSAHLSIERKQTSMEWYIDSGASRHMTPNKDWLHQMNNSSVKEIVVANNERMTVNGVGNAVLRIDNKDIDVKNVLYVPTLSTNLLSVAQIVEKGNSVIFDKNGCQIKNDNGEIMAKTKSSYGVYKFEDQAASCLLSQVKTDVMTWHRRLGHINYVDLCKMKKGAVQGISFNGEAAELRRCEVCYKGKQARIPFKHTGTRAKALLDLIHSDLCGPMETNSIGGAKYFLTFIDDYSRKVFIYLLKGKDEVIDRFKDFKQFVENQVGRRIKSIRTDNGREYVGQQFHSFCRKAGILHQKSNPYTPEQNGVAERMNRTIIERAKCMIFDAGLDKSYWGEAVKAAVYIINLSTCSSLDKSVPEGVWTGTEIDVSNIRIFGSPVMVHIPQQRRRKWDPKSTKLLFVGYSDTTKGYRCIDPATKIITISRNVVFLETSPKLVDLTSNDIDDDNDSVGECSTDETAVDDTREETPYAFDMDLKGSDSIIEDAIDSVDNVLTDNDAPKLEESKPDTVRRTQRPPAPRDFASHGYVSHLAEIQSSELDPVSTKDALSRIDNEGWRAAMQCEMESHFENKTWTLTTLPPGRKAIKSKWVFSTKRNESGALIRYKARLVAKGCSQKYGVDYNEVYSPVVRYTSIRYLVALSVKLKLRIDQMDAVTAFLQSDLSEEIYMEIPEGCGDHSGKVGKLNKAIYGLKQSGRQWNIKLENILKSFGLHKSKMDPCVFHSGNSDLIVAIYVDDIMIFWRNPDIRDSLKKTLSEHFKMKDLGLAKSCVGFNITYDDKTNGIWLDQAKYTRDILQKFGMSASKPVSTPSDVNQKLSSNMCADAAQVIDVPYQEAVGSLLYLAQGTRPDIAFAVNDVSRFNANHGKAHWVAVKRIFRYLKGTSNYKLFYGSCEELRGFSDADWASDIDKRRSCTGYVFTFCGGAISWGSKRQTTVALSSMEAEYMAMSSALQEAMWLKQFGEDVVPKTCNKPIEIACDNQSAIAIAENDCFRARSKHIDVRHHYIRERIADQTVKIRYLPTEEMIADSLTKAVPQHKNIFCVRGMGLSNIEV